jgi:Protein of unknown function (DUF3311)
LARAFNKLAPPMQAPVLVGRGTRAMTSKKANSRWLRYWPRLFLVIPLLAILWVPSYNKIEPALGGVPFFYWYQLAWILVGAAFVLLVYVIDTRITRVAETPPAGVDTTGAPGDIL